MFLIDLIWKGMKLVSVLIFYSISFMVVVVLIVIVDDYFTGTRTKDLLVK